MRRSLVICTAALIAVACAKSAPGSGTAGGSDVATPVDTTRLDAYEAVIRHLVGSESADWETVYVRITLCPNAEGAGGAEQENCDDALTPEEQTGLHDRLAGDSAPLVFVRDRNEVEDRIFSGKEASVFVWMGPIEHDGDNLLVPGSMYCGGLCGTGSTWLLVPDGDRWRVQGPAPGAGVWIS